MLISKEKQLIKGKYIHTKFKIYGEISSLEFFNFLVLKEKPN